MYNNGYLPVGLIMISLALLSPAALLAHDDHAAAELVPQREYAIAAERKLDGPTETRGVSAVDHLGSVDLGTEFAEMDGYEFRAREITIEPDGVIAVHEHNRRPGFAYILEGEIIEHRSDHSEPILRLPGQVAIERTGISHWWENKSGATVRALIVDIFKDPN